MTSSGALAWTICSITAPPPHWWVRFSEVLDFGRAAAGGLGRYSGGRREIRVHCVLRRVSSGGRRRLAGAVSAASGAGRAQPPQAARQSVLGAGGPEWHG